MTRFLDGPAKGETLLLKRDPTFLRVTRGPSGKWDALDQLTDSPRKEEEIFVYRKAGPRGGTVHINARDGKGRRAGGFYTLAEYRIHEPAPEDATLRDVERWRKWCEAAR